MLYYVMLCFVVLCCSVFYSVVLCSVVLCYVMICYLGYVVFCTDELKVAWHPLLDRELRHRINSLTNDHWSRQCARHKTQNIGSVVHLEHSSFNNGPRRRRWSSVLQQWSSEASLVLSPSTEAAQTQRNQ